MNPALARLAHEVINSLRERRLSAVTAESCTAGRLSTLLSEIPGAGQTLHGGFVTYTKAAKARLLGVPELLLKKHGAVCGEVAVAMARGALDRSPADLAIAVTGVAGPEPDEDNNPVGLVCIAAVGKGTPPIISQRHYGNPGPEKVLELAMMDALSEMLKLMIETAHRKEPYRWGDYYS